MYFTATGSCLIDEHFGPLDMLPLTPSQVGLKSLIDSMPGNLDAAVSEFGDNLSTGQRQLICLGRVLLRKCKIILLDEASSSLVRKWDGFARGAGGESSLLFVFYCSRFRVTSSDSILSFAGSRE